VVYDVDFFAQAAFFLAFAEIDCNVKGSFGCTTIAGVVKQLVPEDRSTKLGFGIGFLVGEKKSTVWTLWGD
jgi:hypothetical protein